MKSKNLQLFTKRVANQLKKIEMNPNKVQALVSYYNLLAFIENADHLGKAYLEKLESRNFFGFNKKKIAVLKEFLENTTRNSGGVNRSQNTTSVTASEVYLGNVYGIWTKSAFFWISNQERFEKEDSGISPKVNSQLDFISVWYIINQQAEQILDSGIQNFNKKYDALKAA